MPGRRIVKNGTVRCSRCKEWCPLASFSKNRRSPLGIGSQCYSCRSSDERMRRGPVKPRRPIPPSPDLHWCIGCLKFRPREDFRLSSINISGLSGRCRKCTQAQEKRHTLCPDCGIPISRDAMRCGPCNIKSRQGHSFQNEHGYIHIYKPGRPNAPKTGYVLEHRFVMEEHLGRFLTPSENVHHKNGQRDDNRLENLEIWSTSQPPGQRLEDKTLWAIEWLSEYAPERLAQ